MKILAFSSLFPNAADPNHGIFVYHRTKNLASMPGNQVEVIAPVPALPDWISSARWRRFKEIRSLETTGNIRVHHPRYILIPKVSMPFHGLLMFAGAQRLARKLHRHEAFDCIAAQYVYPDGFAAVLLGKLLRIPVVVWALGTDINLFPSFPAIRPLIRWTLQQAAGIVTVSTALKKRVVELGAPESKVRFIGNGVDCELFRMCPRDEARRTLGLSSSDKVLVSVASLREAKGHQHVITALEKLARPYPELKLYIIGEGEYRPRLENMVRDLGLEGRVCLVGNRSNEEIPLWFNAADASILASSREGWPNVILESLACGTPVIGTGVGQIPEILNSGDLGIVTEQNPEAIAAAIESALGKNWDRALLMNFAHSRPWRTVALESEQYLHSVLGGHAIVARQASPVG